MMKMIAAPLCALLTVGIGQANAQSADRSDRGDKSEFRQQSAQRATAGTAAQLSFFTEGEPTIGKPTFSFKLGSPLQLDTNPENERNGSKDAGYANPLISASFSYPALIGSWDLGATGSTDADIYSRDPDSVDETRLVGSIGLSRALADLGTLSFGFKEKVVYKGAGYSRFNYAVERYVVGLARDIVPGLSITLAGEYRASAKAEQRRFFWSADLSWKAIDTKGFSLTLDQEVDFSAYRGGTNRGRNDALSLTSVTLTPKLDLPDNVDFGIVALLSHRFSNRASVEYTQFQIGPSLTIKGP